MDKVKGQAQLIKELNRLFNIFSTSKAEIRPHFFLTGPSGSGKSYTIQTLCSSMDINYMEINAAQLTKEGTAGNSLSKSLSALRNFPDKPTICFVDEFDKLFISGNNNSDLAHETTNGVQNEFLKVLESNETAVFADYGKYLNVSVKNVLFVFAGAFNNEDEISIDRLRELGVKTEFLGRVGLIFNTKKLDKEAMTEIFNNSKLFNKYSKLFKNCNKEQAKKEILTKVLENFDNNTLGARMINTLIHQYFIKGGFPEESEKKVTFQKNLEF